MAASLDVAAAAPAPRLNAFDVAASINPFTGEVETEGDAEADKYALSALENLESFRTRHSF